MTTPKINKPSQTTNKILKGHYKPGRTRVGTIVSMRHRFHQFINEPFDIVHPNQPFGYINAKYRPCVILGHTSTHVVVAPIKSLKNHPRWLEVPFGGFELDRQSIKDSGLNTKTLGMVIGCGELRQIPKEAFTYDRIIGHLPDKTFTDYKNQLIKYMAIRAESTHPLQFQFDMDQPDNLEFLTAKPNVVFRQDILKSTYLHPEDPLVKYAKSQLKLEQFKKVHNMSDLTNEEYAEFSFLKTKRQKLLKDARTPNTIPPGELRNHFDAIRHGYGTNPYQKRYQPTSKNNCQS